MLFAKWRPFCVILTVLLKHEWTSFLEAVAGRLVGLLACQFEINTACWHKSAGFVDNRYNTDQ